jgi:RHS repeat-associated protein
VQKVVEEFDGSSWAAQDDVRFVYLGWNVIEERHTSAGVSTKKNFVWGLDLSQSMDGAGGIGGLLAVVDEAGSQMAFLYDANGNVGQLVDEAGSTVAKYEYDAFGQVLVASGAAAEGNSWRFSTKMADLETGLVYYGYRFYWPAMGRWVSRDPIEESGRLAFEKAASMGRKPKLARQDDPAYVFARNDAVGSTDPLGLSVYIYGRGYFHGIIRIKSKCNSKYDGVYEFGPVVYPDPMLRIALGVVYWVKGGISTYKGEPYVIDRYIAQVSEDDARYEREVYERIQRDKLNTPPYNALVYNCWDWVREMLTGSYYMNREIAFAAKQSGLVYGEE